ncbi:MAG: hypothetical protein ACE5G7_03800 [Candidatus Hydrothermarchaeaceae archaeon]
MFKTWTMIILLLILASPAHADFPFSDYETITTYVGDYAVVFAISPSDAQPMKKAEITVFIVNIEAQEIYSEEPEIWVMVADKNEGLGEVIEGPAPMFRPGYYKTIVIFPGEGEYVVSAVFGTNGESLASEATIEIASQDTSIRVLGSGLVLIVLGILIYFFRSRTKSRAR